MSSHLISITVGSDHSLIHQVSPSEMVERGVAGGMEQSEAGAMAEYYEMISRGETLVCSTAGSDMEKFPVSTEQWSGEENQTASAIELYAAHLLSPFKQGKAYILYKILFITIIHIILYKIFIDNIVI